MRRRDVPILTSTLAAIRLMNSRLSAVQKEISDCILRLTALQKELVILQEQFGSGGEPALVFDDEQRIVRWQGGAVGLSPQEYRFLRAIWNGTNHSATMDEIEETVWQACPGSPPFKKSKTIMMAFYRLQGSVVRYSLPYLCESVKDASGREISAFQLTAKKPQEFVAAR